jgi:hypothetical protein
LYATLNYVEILASLYNCKNFTEHFWGIRTQGVTQKSDDGPNTHYLTVFRGKLQLLFFPTFGSVSLGHCQGVIRRPLEPKRLDLLLSCPQFALTRYLRVIVIKEYLGMTLLVAQELQTENHGMVFIHFSISLCPPPNNINGCRHYLFPLKCNRFHVPAEVFTSKNLPNATLVRVKKSLKEWTSDINIFPGV